MALVGFTPKQKLTIAAYRFYFWLPCKRGGLPTYYLIYLENRRMTPQMKAFRDWLISECRRSDAELAAQH